MSNLFGCLCKQIFNFLVPCLLEMIFCILFVLPYVNAGILLLVFHNSNNLISLSSFHNFDLFFDFVCFKVITFLDEVLFMLH